MGAILKSNGIAGAGGIFPSRLEFTFYEIALPAAQYENSHIENLGGGWYCYCAMPWFFTYRVPEWSEAQVRTTMARVHKLLW